MPLAVAGNRGKILPAAQHSPVIGCHNELANVAVGNAFGPAVVIQELLALHTQACLEAACKDRSRVQESAARQNQTIKLNRLLKQQWCADRPHSGHFCASQTAAQPPIPARHACQHQAALVRTQCAVPYRCCRCCFAYDGKGAGCSTCPHQPLSTAPAPATRALSIAQQCNKSSAARRRSHPHWADQQ
jgi:hypothetical protein